MELNEIKELIAKNPKEILKISDLVKNKERLIKSLWDISCNNNEPKALIKAAKKALYLIKSKKIDVDLYKPRTKAPLKKEESKNNIENTILSLPDSSGSNLLVITIPNSKNMANDFYQFLINSIKGVERYLVEKVSGRYIKKFKEKNPDFFHIPKDYALYRLNKALKKTDKKEISGIGKVPDILLSKNEKDIEHPVIRIISSNISRIFAQEDEKNLFKTEVIKRIMIPDEDLLNYKKEIEKAKKSKLIIQNKSPEERIRDIIKRFYREYFTEERLSFYSELLFDIAYYFYQKKIIEFTRILEDYGKRLMYQNANLLEHPFISYLVDKGLFMQR